MSEVPPGTASLQIVVADIHRAHDELAGRGVDVSDVQVLAWGHFVTFADPDGNQWAIQYLPSRPNG
ncbi:VOC family protein [Raineyella sp. W15-4]|uniref:VOC family protein n=1 Tax=Raineyella sp. W15-4 TaxID=3081651 RepID=UPI003989FBE9